MLPVAAQPAPAGLPVKCATCKFLWSYSLRDHYEKRHPGIAVPPAMQNAMKLRTHEEEWLKMVKNGKRHQRPARSRAARAAAKDCEWTVSGSGCEFS